MSLSSGGPERSRSGFAKGGAFALIVAGTVLGLAGTDLILPVIPQLPGILGGDHARAQLVLAAFVAGAAAGLLLFGWLGAHFDQRILLALSLAAYAAVSALAGWAGSVDALIALRFVQGIAGSAAATFAPGMIRALFGDVRAVSALGVLGSVESLTPAAAPLAGLWLFQAWGWNAAFETIAVLAALVAAAVLLSLRHIPAPSSPPAGRGYWELIGDCIFLRYALSHAFTLGGLLVIVFAAPTAFVTSLGGSFGDFVVMQVSGIAAFIVAANVTGRLCARLGSERLVWAGTLLSAAGAAAMLAYAMLGGDRILVFTALFIPVNAGLGLRGPPGFHLAVIAARGDDARGAALVVVGILATTAAGSACVAPFVTSGLGAAAFAAALLSGLALALLRWLPPLRSGQPGQASVQAGPAPPPG